MLCPRTQHRSNVPILRGEKQDISLKILHQAGFETPRQAVTSAKRHALTIVPCPSLVNAILHYKQTLNVNLHYNHTLNVILHYNQSHNAILHYNQTLYVILNYNQTLHSCSITTRHFTQFSTTTKHFTPLFFTTRHFTHGPLQPDTSLMLLRDKTLDAILHYN